MGKKGQTDRFSDACETDHELEQVEKRHIRKRPASQITSIHRQCIGPMQSDASAVRSTPASGQRTFGTTLHQMPTVGPALGLHWPVVDF